MSSSGFPFSTVYQGRYQLRQLLGRGGFGDVYGGVDDSTGRAVAIKCERVQEKRSWLFHEAKIMHELCQTKPVGIPYLHYFGQEGDYYVLVMSCLGPSLEDYHEKYNRFSLKTTCMLMWQMLLRLEFIHQQGYIHRDLKPDNFLMGLKNYSYHVFLIDFGLSTKYMSAPNVHREMQSGKPFIGTTRYASLGTHQGRSQSRRDDMEQLAYIAVYMYRGRLPWSGLNIKDRDAKEKTIGNMKEELAPAEICHKCPKAFEHFLIYSRKMQFDERPDYERCRSLFENVLKEGNNSIDFMYDWVEPPRDTRSPYGNSLPSCSTAHARMVASGLMSSTDLPIAMQMLAQSHGHDPLNDSPQVSSQALPPVKRGGASPGAGTSSSLLPPLANTSGTPIAGSKLPDPPER